MKKQFSTPVLLVTALFCLILTGCNMPQAATPTSELAGVVASTRTAIAVSQFLTATNLPAELPATSTLASVQLTPTAIASEAPIQLTQIGPPTSEAAQPSTQPTVQVNCRYAAKFEGETIPDGSAFMSDQEFLKTWILRNVGTCTWRPETSLIFVRGEQMSGASSSSLGKSITPNSTIQVSVPLRAPAAAGQYQGYWKLRSPEGVEFGLGANADVAFWVKIQVVAESGSATINVPFGGPQNLGAPIRLIDFEGKTSPWYLGTDENIDYDLKGSKLLITSSSLTGDRWRVANPGFLEDFFLQVSFKTGNACSGKDGYGVLVRAPDKSSGNINSGYVFSFSCDGKYRVYRIDNGNFNGIQNWTTSPALIAGTNQSNHMGILADGNEFQLYANGILVFQFSDSTYSDGLYGLMIRSEATNNFQVAVEEIVIWNIP
jgi:hypothetical protein